MSPEAAFAPLSFPALPGQPVDERDSIRGHAAGYAAGRKQAEAELASLRAALQEEAAQAASLGTARLGSALEALARAADDLRSRQAPALSSVDVSIAAAALELAEAIVGYELQGSSAKAALERATVEAVPEGTVVRLNPLDAQLIAAEGTASGVQLVADPTLDPGDAVVELVDGALDARVAQSLTRAKAVLAEGRA